MMKEKLIFLISVTILTALISFPDTSDATPWSPMDWRDNGKLRNWVRDGIDNFVDDLIEAKTGQVDITVDLNQCIGDPAKSELVEYLESIGDVMHIGKYLSYIVVKDVPVREVYDIATRSEVAMVELADDFRFLGENTQAAQISDSTEYNDRNLEDIYRWPTDLNGEGINIAFIDTGVGPDYDDVFVHGFNAISDREENPPPVPEDYDHATWMAHWVWSRHNGTAPEAGLIDMKVSNTGTSTEAGAIERALSKAYDMRKREDWNINVVTLMIGRDGAFWDDRDHLSQLINLLQGNSVVVVAGAGDNRSDAPVSDYASASRAIAVGAASIEGTVYRGDDRAYLVKGPRAPDSDPDPIDELKPEVVMPTGQGSTQVSNSIAAALTSGLVALILDYNEDLANHDNRAAGSIKDLLIRTADPEEPPHPDASSYPEGDPTWNEYWGYGEINAFEAFQHLSGAEQEGRADLTFIGYDGSEHPHPSDPWYYSHAIDTESWRNDGNIETEADDKIYARIHNNGPGDANNVRVSFGFYAFSAGQHVFNDIGSVVESFRNGETKEVSIDWLPPRLHPGEHHGCIMVTIDYGYDTNFRNMSNFAQRNVYIERASSPAEFTFNVENPLPTKARIDLRLRTEYRDWTIKLSETNFSMAPHDCARTISAIVEPPAQVEPGTEAIFFVTAYATGEGAGKSCRHWGCGSKSPYRRENSTVMGLVVYHNCDFRNTSTIILCVSVSQKKKDIALV